MNSWPVWLICCSLAGGAVLGQQRTPAPPLQDARAIRGAELPGVPAVDSLRRITTSVEQFEQLVSLPRDQRTRILSTKPEPSRAYVESELEKYEALPADERMEALRALRVRYYLRELVKHPRAVREQALQSIPERDREPIESRLQRWDRLPAALQQDVLDDERTIHYVLRLDELGPRDDSTAPPPVPDVARIPRDEGLDRWHALPREQRQRVYAQFHRFFELSPRERAKVLETLPEKERMETLESLRVLERLPREERDACLESLRRVTEMPPASRQSFLLTAERWSSMAEEEKRVWKRLTTVLPPGMTPPMPGDPPRPAPAGDTKPPPALPGAPR